MWTGKRSSTAGPTSLFDPFKFLNWRLYSDVLGRKHDRKHDPPDGRDYERSTSPLPTAAYLSGGVFSEKDERQVRDTIAVTVDFPNDGVVTFQSTFSNRRYGLGQRILGCDGTIEYVAAANDMVTGRSEDEVHYYREKR